MTVEEPATAEVSPFIAGRFVPLMPSQPTKEDAVESVALLEAARSDAAMWFVVKLKEKPEPLAIHANWFMTHGKLKPGERVKYAESVAKLRKDGGQGINQEGLQLVDLFRKIGKEEEALLGGAPDL